MGQILVGAHDVEIEIRFDIEQPEHPVEHTPVLRGDADLAFDRRCVTQGVDHGGHLDGLGAGAENAENAHGRRFQPVSVATDPRKMELVMDIAPRSNRQERLCPVGASA